MSNVKGKELGHCAKGSGKNEDRETPRGGAQLLNDKEI